VIPSYEFDNHELSMLCWLNFMDNFIMKNLFTILESLEWDILLGEVLQTPKWIFVEVVLIFRLNMLGYIC
jgi:hypothetical protein